MSLTHISIIMPANADEAAKTIADNLSLWAASKHCPSEVCIVEGGDDGWSIIATVGRDKAIEDSLQQILADLIGEAEAGSSPA